MIEIERDEYDELLDMATRLSIIKRMITDEENQGYERIDTKVLKQVLGMYGDV
jgi:hypothetical protein